MAREGGCAIAVGRISKVLLARFDSSSCQEISLTVLDSLRGVDLIEVLRDRLGPSAASAPLALLKGNERLSTQSTLKDPWIILKFQFFAPGFEAKHCIH